MKLGTRPARRSFSEGVNPELGIKGFSFYILHSAFCIKIIPVLILLLSSSGCLFMRPLAPSARLIPANQLSYSFNAGAVNFTGETVEVEYDYYGGISSRSMSIVNVTQLCLDMGIRARIPGTNLEIGASLLNFLGASLDFKYAFTTPDGGSPLIALNAAVYALGVNETSFGFSAGPIINVPLVEESKFDLVLASFYQYCDFRSFNLMQTETAAGESEYGYYTYNNYYSVAPSKNSLYFYAGIEFAMDNGNVIAPGVSYTHFIGSSFQPGIITGGLAFKYGAAEPSINIKDPDNVPSAGYFITQAEKLIETGSIKAASQILDQGLSVYPGDYDLSLMQGFCMARLGNKRRAYSHYRNALSLDPDNINLRASVTELWNEIKGK